MKLSLVNGPTVHVTVMSAAEAIVGEYSVYVETRTKSRESGEELTYRIKHSESMYILFNAWCKGKHSKVSYVYYSLYALCLV